MSLLNVPFLLKQLYPDARYILNSRKFEDLVWLETEIAKPTIYDLEREQQRIDGLETDNQTRVDVLVQLEQATGHDRLVRAKESAKLVIADLRHTFDQEIGNITMEMARLREKMHEEIREQRKVKVKELELETERLKDVLLMELAIAHNQMINEVGAKAHKRLVTSKDRAAIFPSKEEMQRAIKGGREEIKKLAKRIKK
tara:strand:- start:2651 stop:3247 length:597 start_codon:yes stop_codon:yes gene_type:complete